MTVTSQEQLLAAKEDVLINLARVYRSASGSSIVTSTNGIKLSTKLQVLFSLRFKDPCAATIYESIMNHAVLAERFGPGGFDKCIELLVRFLTSNTAIHIKAAKSSLDDTRRSGTLLAKSSDLEVVIAGCLDNKLRDLVTTAFKLSGFGGRIMIEKSATDVISVELLQGYSFDVKPSIPVTATFTLPHIACIDGFVESVGELHSVLETVNQTKSSLLLFLRGLADDVESTLKVNYDRGSLRVVPIIVPFDFEGINTLVDVAIASGGDVVSSTKGQLISSLTVSDFVSIPKAIVYQDKIVLINPGSSKRVQQHVKLLRDKRPDDESLARLNDLRVKSLSPNQVVIRLPDDDQFVVNSQMIDHALRSVKALIDHGVLPTGEPAAGIIGGTYHAMKCATLLHDCGAVITP